MIQRFVSVGLVSVIMGALVVALVMFSQSSKVGTEGITGSQAIGVTPTPTRRPPQITLMPTVGPNQVTSAVYATMPPPPVPPTPNPLAQGKIDGIAYTAHSAPNGQVAITWEFDGWTRANLEQYVSTNRRLLGQVASSSGGSVFARVIFKERVPTYQLFELARNYGLTIEYRIMKNAARSGPPITTIAKGGPAPGATPPVPTTPVPLAPGDLAVIIIDVRVSPANLSRLAADPRVYFLDVSAEAVYTAVRQAVGTRALVGQAAMTPSPSLYLQLELASLVNSGIPLDYMPPLGPDGAGVGGNRKVVMH